MRAITYFIAVIILFSCATRNDRLPKVIDLHDEWTFSRQGDDNPYPAHVPGNIHLDLMRVGQIPDPFYGDNENKVQWVEKETWSYQTRFLVPAVIMDQEKVELCFEGLDTHADVFLNGSRILVADNMFRTYRCEVKELLNKGYNTLKIQFSPADSICIARESSHAYPLPDRRGFIRKAPYQFGWDWGPRLVTCGIWKPVKLSGWSKARILSAFVTTDSIEDVNRIANMRLSVDVESIYEQHCDLQLTVDNEMILLKKVSLRAGENIIRLSFNVKDPSLWDCSNPHLYHFTVALSDQYSKLDSRDDRFGIRTVELVTEKDQYGSSFFFKLNGKPLFMKGANLIPLDNFPSRVSDKRYEDLVRNAAEANMNMLRVWGGGIYENDIFYDLCDEHGILVWQDLMFACNLYPGTEEFLDNVEKEAADQVRRLRGHPCIALWCGNNEIAEGWHNWGWQEQLDYSEEDSSKAWEDYQRLFERALPDIVRKYDGTRDYWPSSPKHGWGREESLHDGDMHYWGVWWGEEPFDKYEEKTGRFMSEYGFQGFPDMVTLEKYLEPADLHLGSPALANHQKHPRGMELIKTYMERDYLVPGSLRDYIYLSQLLQAEGMKTAIEAHRRDMPRCMGTLFWQLNDCWPAISWSAIDYLGNRKALFYFARKAYQETILSVESRHDSLFTWLISDKESHLEGELDIFLLNFSGDVLFHERTEVELKVPAASVVFKKDIKTIPGERDPSRVLMFAEFKSIDDERTFALKYFVKPKEMRLPEPVIGYDKESVPGGVLYTLRSEMLIKNIYLSHPGHEGYFEDNHFDLLPQRPVKVLYRTGDAIDLPDLEWRSLW